MKYNFLRFHVPYDACTLASVAHTLLHRPFLATVAAFHLRVPDRTSSVTSFVVFHVEAAGAPSFHLDAVFITRLADLGILLNLGIAHCRGIAFLFLFCCCHTIIILYVCLIDTAKLRYKSMHFEKSVIYPIFRQNVRQNACFPVISPSKSSFLRFPRMHHRVASEDYASSCNTPHYDLLH